ncbi:MAG: tetratricopeptide repeat protein [Pyrinomonadaceae bacterium]
MKWLFTIALITGAYFLLPVQLPAQIDEVRQATGLPIPVGTAAIYGQIEIRGLSRGERKPIVFVTLFIGGAQVDRMRATDDGYYYFLVSPRNGAIIVVESSGTEVGRVSITGGTGSSVRQDIAFDWHELQRSAQRTGVVQANPVYKRSNENQELFQRAMTAEQKKKPDTAAGIYKQIVDQDPKDFVAWTQLGTVFFGDSKYSDAEKAYLRAIELKTDYGVALMNLGNLYFAQKLFEKAIPIFYKAAAADPTSADAFHYLGESFLQIKQGSKAVIALNEAIRLAPDEKADIHLRLATLYNAAGLKDRAAAEYKLFLEKRPDHPDKGKLRNYIKENSKGS